ncbi:hypothetical protein BDV34DRAFT_195083 [Aspergillus parasiticus]|uniref:Transcription factor domain-containing protein n=1 Tax=Aspergillus parasiticus TaxID=5067 RepID=A0A5N6DKT2_ASPPA|nr:hypothetical protein BDV34DRAFT_195083 [Aspergillus parasiticus]
MPSSLEKGKESWTRPHLSPFLHAPAAPDLIPGPEVAMFLIETYFTHVITSSLLFNYKILVRDYRASLVPKHVLLGIFAIASLFHRETSPDQSIFALSPNLAGQGYLWAELSGQAVRAMAENPSISTIQACEMLSVYWYVKGEPTRAMMYAGLSRETSRVLEWVARSRDQSKENSIPPSIRQAQWIQECLTDYDVALSNVSETCAPGFDEHADSNCIVDGRHGPIASEYILENNDWMIWDYKNARSSAKYFVEGLTLWRETRHLVKRFRAGAVTSLATEVFGLDTKLRRFYSSIPAELKPPESLDESKKCEKAQRNGFCLQSIYYCCSLYLWSSMVPPLSNQRSNTTELPVGFADYGTVIVMQHVKMFVQSARAYLTVGAEFKKIPPFVGYCAYIAGSIQTHTFCFRNCPGDSLSWAQGMLCFLILEELKTHWPMLNSMYNNLKTCISRADNGLLLLPRTALLDLVSAQCDFGVEWPGPISCENVFVELDDAGCNPFLNKPYVDFLWDTHKSLATREDNDRSIHQTFGSHLAREDSVSQGGLETDGVVREVEPTRQAFTKDHLFNFDEILSGCSMDAISGESAELITDDPLDGQNLEMSSIERV